MIKGGIRNMTAKCNMWSCIISWIKKKYYKRCSWGNWNTDYIIEESVAPMLFPKKDDWTVVWGDPREESVGAQKEWGFS